MTMEEKIVRLKYPDAIVVKADGTYRITTPDKLGFLSDLFTTESEAWIDAALKIVRSL